MTPVETQKKPEISAPNLALSVHPWRSALYEELHSRPSPVINGPCLVTHFTVQFKNGEKDYDYVADLCRRFSVPIPAAESSCLYQDFGGFELRWERHLEFSNYTFIFSCDNPFVADSLSCVPKDWLAAMPGQLVVALNIVFLEENFEGKDLKNWFEGQRATGSIISEDKAQVWTTFKLHSDGFGRMIVRNNSLNPYQNGRLVQRLCEIETYRLMSLLALPLAREISSKIKKIEERFIRLNFEIADINQGQDERALLQELSQIAAEVEHHRSESNYRFSATTAYYDIVSDRLKQLKERPLEGMQGLHEFLERRLTPSVKTCHSTRDRLKDLSIRINRTTSLLRTRVDLSIQEQNQNLLASMNRRSQMQLRLQQTVEGLSVVAISYYLVSLLGFVYLGLNEYGVIFNAEIAKGISAPLVVVLVYFGVRRVKAKIKHQSHKLASKK
ncbi:MAG: DUF3422 domain-containing protein [Venatoribacter sp.]